MYGVIVFIVVAVLAYIIVRKFLTVKRFDSNEEYLKYKQKQKDLLKQEEEEWDDEFIDKKSFDFLFLGAVATILFLICGLFTDNSFYFILILFVITAMLYLYFYPPKGNF